jgi:hypothetical protein
MTFTKLRFLSSLKLNKRNHLKQKSLSNPDNHWEEKLFNSLFFKSQKKNPNLKRKKGKALHVFS